MQPSTTLTLSKKIKFLLLLLLVPVAAIVVLIGFLFLQELKPLPAIRPMPAVNGYEDLVKAAQMLPSKTSDFEAMNEGQLRELVAANAEALSLARVGLSRECRATIKFSPNMENHLKELAGIKRLAQALAAEGRLAETENRRADATKSYLDVIHLGNESARGGVVIDQLVGTAVCAIGNSHLQKLVGGLDAKACREAATALETLDEQRQTWDDVVQQENAWSRRTFPGVGNRLVALMAAHRLQANRQTGENRFKRQQTQTRRLVIDLAARAYERDKGHRPASPADLVPDYLKALPQDPVTGKNMVYRP